MKDGRRRWMALVTRLIAAASVVIWFEPIYAAADEGDMLEENRIAWNEFLLKECKAGQTEQMIRKQMAGKFRDFGFARANDEIYRLVFLIDDYNQVEFAFRRDAKLVLTPTIEPKTQWLRLPNGNVLTIPYPAEVKFNAKAQEVAIRYVAERTKHSRDSLVAFCRRSEKSQKWDVVVSIDSLVVDGETFLLEVTDSGQVRKLGLFDKDVPYR